MTVPGFWRVVDGRPEAVACVLPTGEVWTASDLRSRMRKVHTLLTGAQITRGMTVGAVTDPIHDFLAVQLAALERGLYFVPLDHRLALDEVVYVLSDTRPSALFSGQASFDLLLKAVRHSDVPGAVLHHFREVVPLPETSVDALHRTAGQTMYYTSGSTGRPKAVRRPLPDSSPEAFLSRTVGEVAAMYGLVPFAGTHLVSSSLAHIGPNAAALRALHLGHALVFLDRVSPEGLLQAIETNRITSLHMVPSVFSALLSLGVEVRKKYDISSVTHIVHTGEACPVHLKREMISWFGSVLHEVYAATEFRGTYVDSESWLAKPGTVGKAVPGSRLLVLDDMGRPCPPGVEGTIYVCHPDNAFEYLHDPVATAAGRIGDCVTTGDRGYLDPDGWLFLRGRRSDLILVGGQNVSAAEIERVLLLDPRVKGACAVGADSEFLGQLVVAMVEPTGPTSPDQLSSELLIRCRQSLSRYKWPARIYIGELPHLPSGKVDRNRVREEMSARLRATAPARGPVDGQASAP